MIFEYRAQPGDRWMVVNPEMIYAHDFMNPNFVVRVTLKSGEQDTIRDWLTFEKFYEGKVVANYANATDESRDAINPSHYKQLLIITESNGQHVDTLQWLEHLQYKPFWRNNMRAFVAAVMDLCADKYLSRMGMKDRSA